MYTNPAFEVSRDPRRRAQAANDLTPDRVTDEQVQVVLEGGVREFVALAATRQPTVAVVATLAIAIVRGMAPPIPLLIQSAPSGTVTPFRIESTRRPGC
jgi:hypothetical protein